MRDTTTINNIIEQASIWLPGEEDTFKVKFADINGSKIAQLTVSELASVNPRLPFYLRDVFGRITAMHLPVEVVGSSVLETLTNWRSPYLTIDATDGFTHTIKTVHSVNWDRTMDLVVWYFDCLSMLPFEWDSPMGPQQAHYVTGGYHHIADTDVAWMDVQYPGWRQRFDVSENLELGDSDRASFVLGVHIAQPIVDFSDYSV